MAIRAPDGANKSSFIPPSLLERLREEAASNPVELGSPIEVSVYSECLEY